MKVLFVKHLFYGTQVSNFKLILIFWLVCSTAFAQKESFNRFTYIAPSGWKKVQDGKKLFFENVDGSKFCQIYLWCMTDSKGSNQADFENDWQSLIANSLTVNGKPQTDKHKENGWDVTVGMAEASFQNNPLAVMLVTCTKGKLSFSISSNFNDESYVSQINQFIEKVDIVDDTNSYTEATNNKQKTTDNQPNNATTSGSSGTGITLAQTNFDDGWVSTISTNYVRVTKNAVEVRLYFPDDNVDKTRGELGQGRIFEYHYWDIWVKPDFQVDGVYERPFVTGMSAILEAPVTYKQTGQRGYAALMLYFENGVCVPIVGFAPTRELLNEYLPNHDGFEKMLKYNKFAATSSDIVGKWSSSSGASINYYNSVSGQYVGSNTAAGGDKFIFANNGIYSSSHSFYTTSAGAGKQDYNGKYTVNVWTVNLSNRQKDDSGEYWVKFEAIKGGRILHPMNKKFTGQRYRLFKE